MLIFIFTLIVTILGLAGVITHKILKTKFESSITALVSKTVLIVGCIFLVMELIAVGVGGSSSKAESFTTERAEIISAITSDVGSQKRANKADLSLCNYDEDREKAAEFNSRLESTKVSAQSVWTNWFYPSDITAEPITEEEVNSIIENTPAKTMDE